MEISDRSGTQDKIWEYTEKWVQKAKLNQDFFDFFSVVIANDDFSNNFLQIQIWKNHFEYAAQNFCQKSLFNSPLKNPILTPSHNQPDPLLPNEIKWF